MHIPCMGGDSSKNQKHPDSPTGFGLKAKINMKRVALVVVALALTLPGAAWANSGRVAADHAGEDHAAGSRSLPDEVVFAGRFTGPSSSMALYNPTGFKGESQASASLRRSVIGKGSKGFSAVDSAEQASFDSPKGKGLQGGDTLDYGAATVTVPEPGTLGLLGTGLLGIAGLIRRRLKNRN